MATLTMTGTDTELRERVQRQLEFDPEVEEANVAVSVSKGVVTLAGLTGLRRQLEAGAFVGCVDWTAVREVLERRDGIARAIGSSAASTQPAQ